MASTTVAKMTTSKDIMATLQVPRTGFASLPNEIILSIIQYANDDPKVFMSRGGLHRMKNLLEVMLFSKTFRAFAESILYSNVILYGPVALGRFLRTILDRPDLVDHVKSFRPIGFNFKHMTVSIWSGISSQECEDKRLQLNLMHRAGVFGDAPKSKSPSGLATGSWVVGVVLLLKLLPNLRHIEIGASVTKHAHQPDLVELSTPCVWDGIDLASLATIHRAGPHFQRFLTKLTSIQITGVRSWRKKLPGDLARLSNATNIREISVRLDDHFDVCEASYEYATFGATTLNLTASLHRCSNRPYSILTCFPLLEEIQLHIVIDHARHARDKRWNRFPIGWFMQILSRCKPDLKKLSMHAPIFHPRAYARGIRRLGTRYYDGSLVRFRQLKIIDILAFELWQNRSLTRFSPYNPTSFYPLLELIPMSTEHLTMRQAGTITLVQIMDLFTLSRRKWPKALKLKTITVEYDVDLLEKGSDGYCDSFVESLKKLGLWHKVVFDLLWCRIDRRKKWAVCRDRKDLPPRAMKLEKGKGKGKVRK